MIKHLLTLSLASAVLAVAAPALPETEPLSSGIECPAAIALTREGGNLSVTLDVDAIPGATGAPKVTLGLAAAESLVLNSDQAKLEKRDGGWRFQFSVPTARLAKTDADWNRLRVAAAAEFPGGPAGQPLYHVRYRHTDSRALHAPFSTNPDHWQPFDLTAYQQRLSDRASRVQIAFEQPMDGKATLIINDAQGQRVRTLVAGEAYAKGPQVAEWNLLDDAGSVVPPGDYRWSSLHHAGIKPDYLFSYANDGKPAWRDDSGPDGWGPDHSCYTSVAAVGSRMFFLSPCSEAGVPGAITTPEGNKQLSWKSGVGVANFKLASDGRQVFVAADNGKKKVIRRYDPNQSGTQVPFVGGKSEVVWESEPSQSGFKPGHKSFSQADWEAFNLAGFTEVKGKLAVATRSTQEILFFDAETGEPTGKIPLPNPGELAAQANGTLCAVSGDQIVRIAPGAEKPQVVVPSGRLKPGAMVFSKDQRTLYVVDRGTSQIAILDAETGKETGRLGKPGGAYAGKYDSERMVNPLALAISENGWLWVTEDRFNPKRVLAWDLANGKVVAEKFGPPGYGAPDGGFDSQDPTRFVGQGAIWKVDLEKRTAVPESVLFVRGDSIPHAMHWRFIRQDGRTFLMGSDSVISLVELMPDGSGKLLGQYGNAQAYCFSQGTELSAEFLETFYQQRDFPPDKRNKLHEGKLPHNSELFVWSDQNGDAKMQASELEFAAGWAGGYWGLDQEVLDVVVPLAAGGPEGKKGRWLARLPVQGWHPSGAPKWKPLTEGIAEARLAAGGDRWSSEAMLMDRGGSLYSNSSPLTAFNPDLSVKWTYPNNWAGVHQSHGAPLPRPGQMQGALFFLGNAPLPDGKTDVMVINGNHGRFFVLTSDGFYLDEMFHDVRAGAARDAYLIGGEVFGGFFGGNPERGYYLISGHTDYRIFRLQGLDTLTRSPGASLTVTPAQLEAADRRVSRQSQTGNALAKKALISRLSEPPKMDGTGTGWPENLSASWSKDDQFPVTVQAAWDDTKLYVRWSVEDPSPWKNRGDDDTQLFKTGDSVDLQLGTDASAAANRPGPVPGDLRLLIAPFNGKPTAVLYRHRVPGTKEPVPFSSPWRTENVDVVQRLENAEISVKPVNIANKPGYVVEAGIPLADLGFRPEVGKEYRGDFGAIFGDPDGTINQLRSYWSNPATGLVNDVPGEIMLQPSAWGTFTFEGKK